MDLDTVTTDLTDRLDRLESTLRERIPIDRFTAADPIVTTSWPRRLFWMMVGMGAGAAAAYLADPERGRARRTQLQDQLTARGRDLADTATKRADHAGDVARGAVAETARKATPEDVPDDPKVLEARIRSEVLGHRDDVEKVVLRVDGPGQVAVKGTVPSPAAERDLLAEIARVEGVEDVTNELSVAGS